VSADVCIDVFGGGSGPWVWVDQGIWWLDDVLLDETRTR
jgi:hypothetical protein